MTGDSMQVLDQQQEIARAAIRRLRPPVWKRTIDIVASMLLVLCFLPLFLVVAAWIKCVSRGPVFFRQLRVGHGGNLFPIIKFRTMHSDSNATENHREYLRNLEPSEPFAKPEIASRLIAGGGLIRKCSIDELPQLWNVLFGDMSLVGPRPDVMMLQDYKTNRELRRFEVQPGITGLWQVSGKNSLSYDEMIDLDLRYIDHLSLWNDCSIMLRTFRVLVNQDNN